MFIYQINVRQIKVNHALFLLLNRGSTYPSQVLNDMVIGKK